MPLFNRTEGHAASDSCAALGTVPRVARTPRHVEGASPGADLEPIWTGLGEVAASWELQKTLTGTAYRVHGAFLTTP